MTTELDAIERTVHKTNEWIAAISGCLGGPKDRKRAYVALRAVLHALRDRLPPDHVASLGAQLPLLVRGLYYEGWQPHGKPLKVRNQQEFLALVEQEYQDSGLDAEDAARAVFRVMQQHLASGEAEKVQRLLPRPLAELWAAPRD